MSQALYASVTSLATAFCALRLCVVVRKMHWRGGVSTRF
jgi:hypothetical protein